jgi:hypothetical protein
VWATEDLNHYLRAEQSANERGEDRAPRVLIERACATGCLGEARCGVASSSEAIRSPAEFGVSF